MSTDLVRRCDQCREIVPLARVVYVVSRVELAAAPDGRVVGLASPRDYCGEQCFTNAMRSLFREAALESAPASVATQAD